VGGQKLFCAGSNVRWPLNVVSAPFLCRASQIALLSTLPADLTPDARISQAFHEATACVSTAVYGSLASVARFLKSFTISVAAGPSLFRRAGLASKIVTASKRSAGGPSLRSGPGAGNRLNMSGGE